MGIPPINVPNHSVDTYSILRTRETPPTLYEIVSSQLLYYPKRGFEVETPIANWYRQYQKASILQAENWEVFADPQETTYASYIHQRNIEEEDIDNIKVIQDETYIQSFSSPWRDTLENVFAPIRYPLHGLHMVAGYLGHMAPSGRITLTALFQCADELARIERLAYRTKQLQLVWPNWGDGAKEAWQSAPQWQPLRKTMEQLLVTYDWGEVLIALNLCVKPFIDEVLCQLGSLAMRNNDPGLSELIRKQHDRNRWHEQWTLALCSVAVQQNNKNNEAILHMMDRWLPESRHAAGTLLDVFTTQNSLAVVEERLRYSIRCFQHTNESES